MTTGNTTATKRLLVRGIVQGVGFRPFVYREARRLGLSGWVRNGPAGVEILVQGPGEQVQALIETLQAHAPPAARIDRIEAEAFDTAAPVSSFEIQPSFHDGQREASLLPDLATCPECLREMRDPSDRRYRYPFINCTHCGPRYSIMHRLPYDRANTTMRMFTLCRECRREYENPADRRFHAQPLACPACGPQLVLQDGRGRTLALRDDALLEAAQAIRAGRIVAVKGIGGFHLMCDATNGQAVMCLRERKHRVGKPFALMMADLDMIARYASASPEEQESLCSPAAPIVLLEKARAPYDNLLPDAVAPGQTCLGIMLPYAPLHHLLMDELNRPLVATSGNVSDEPICTDEYDALERLGDLADLFLVHNRPIAHAVDDSLMRMALGRPLRLRVARGWAPLTLPRPSDTGADSMLAVGPHMKATLALATESHFIISPHIGDLETVPAWQSFERNLETLEGIYGIRSTTVACDEHPDYASTRYARRRSNAPVPVQHHHAHILAVMAEHGVKDAVLGMALDGTGYGPDGTIWGGEILVADPHGYRRAAHLRTFPLPGGDTAAREPRRSLFGILHEVSGDVGEARVTGFAPAEIRTLHRMISRNINTVRTSSAGRLFDAVASLLGLIQQTSFEGQAAMLVQAAAEKAGPDDRTYPVAISTGTTACIDWEPCITGIIHDRNEGVPASVIARRFHQWLARALTAMADRHAGLPVVLAGGCFQNTLLLALTVSSLRSRGHMVYWPNLLPPNDGGISAGQLLAAGWSRNR